MNIASSGALVYLKVGDQDISIGQSVNLFNKVGEYAVGKKLKKYPKHLHTKVAIARIIERDGPYAIGYITHANNQALHKNGYAK